MIKKVSKPNGYEQLTPCDRDLYDSYPHKGDCRLMTGSATCCTCYPVQSFTFKPPAHKHCGCYTETKLCCKCSALNVSENRRIFRTKAHA